ncbi:hypothetical protein FB45DRAFT_920747 [Roridomyces roridus]|uniref:Zn(2)-C6 fungal-type domain-containing protein n=1 Tax=Roridomyces roridus TaxID=1738132 RepID=A0AAD7BPX3_9AGAR|nr:hypothetical protein FB45DRAFT_920747 [Roridomyces roridus]
MSSQLSNGAPYDMKPRRTILACSICRKRKLRCITFEQPPRNPCERCVRKNLPCEYIAMSIAQELVYQPIVNAADTHSYGQFQPQPQHHHPRPPAPLPFYPYSPQYAHPYATPYGHTGHTIRRALLLPYTAPPPAGSRPRYYGQPLPPLSDDCLPIPIPPPPTPPLCDFTFVQDAELELELEHNMFFCYDDSDRSSQSSPYSWSSTSQSLPTYQ